MRENFGVQSLTDKGIELIWNKYTPTRIDANKVVHTTDDNMLRDVVAAVQLSDERRTLENIWEFVCSKSFC